jgi:Rhs element Vgr protein
MDELLKVFIDEQIGEIENLTNDKVSEIEGIAGDKVSEVENAVDSKINEATQLVEDIENQAKDKINEVEKSVNDKINEASALAKEIESTATSKINEGKAAVDEKVQQAEAFIAEAENTVKEKTAEVEAYAQNMVAEGETLAANIEGNINQKVAEAESLVETAKKAAENKVAEAENYIKDKEAEAKKLISDTEDKVKEKVNQAENYINDKIEDVEGKVKDVENAVADKIDEVVNYIKSAEQAAKDKVAEAEQAVKDKIAEVEQGVKDAEQAVKDKVQEIEDAIKNKVEAVENEIKNKVQEVEDAIKNKVSEVENAIKNKIAETEEAIKGKVEDVENAIKDKIKAAEDVVKNKVEAIENEVKDKVKAVEDVIKNKVEAIENEVKDKIQAVEDAIVNKVEEVENAIKNKVEEVEKMINDKIDQAETFINGKVDEIEGAISSVNDKIGEVEGQITGKIQDVETIIDDTIAKANEKIEAVKELINNTEEIINDAVDIFGGESSVDDILETPEIPDTPTPDVPEAPKPKVPQNTEPPTPTPIPPSIDAGGGSSSDAEVYTYSITSEGSEIKGHYGLVSVEIVKEINKIGYAKITFFDGDVMDGKFEISEAPEFEPGKEIVIKLGRDSKNKQVFKGIVINHNIKIVEGRGQLEVECYDKAIKLTARRNNKLFEKKKDSEIISELLGNAGVKKSVFSTVAKHEQVIQYDATDWDFILARAEANGLVIINEDGEVAVTMIDPTGGSKLELEFGTDIYDFDLGVSSYAQVPSVETVAWNISKQAVEKVKSKQAKEVKQGDLKASNLAKVMGTEPYAMHATTPLVKAELQSWADGYANRAALAKLKGTVAFIGNGDLKLSEIITLKGLGKRFNGDGYISGIRHNFEPGYWKTTCTLGLQNKYAVQTYNDLNTMPTSGLLPAISGLQIGIVTQTWDDPEGLNRVKVKLPTWDAAKEVWARIISPYASKDIGIVFMPEPNDEVVVGFFNDDPRYPVIVGSLYSSKHKPPYSPDKKNKIKAIVTREKMKIEFNEEKKIITIETPNKNTIIIDDDAKKIIIKDQNENMIELSDAGIVFDTPKDLKITAKGNVSIDAKQAITLKAGTDLKTEGLNVNAKAKVALALEGLTAELKASTQATIKGAMVMIN